MDKKEPRLDYHATDKPSGKKVHFLSCTRGDLLLMEYSCCIMTPMEYIHFLLCKELYPPDGGSTLN